MSNKHSHTIRIISGVWRGRKLNVLDSDQLRPSMDRLRETLFNWLQPIIVGSRCLDAFAGTGALGFEAASRGAKSVTMLEKSSKLCQNLSAQAEKLQADQIQIINTRAEAYLANTGEPFDIVFLDPPFNSDLLSITCDLLTRNNWIKTDSHIYLEANAKSGFPELPANWGLLRNKKAGGVCYGLANNNKATDI